MSENKDTAHKKNAYFSQKWLVLSAVMTGGFMFSVDGSVVNLILPTLIVDLKTDFTMVQWVIISKLLGVIFSLLILCRTLGQTAGVAVLGVVWVVRTQHNSPNAIENVIDAPIEARIQGMQDISTLSFILIGVAFMIIALVANCEKS